MSGLVFGAVVMRRFKLEGRKAASFLIISSLLGGTIAAIRLGLGCYSDVSAVGQLGRQDHLIVFNMALKLSMS